MNQAEALSHFEIFFNEETKKWNWRLPNEWNDEMVSYFWACADEYAHQLYYKDLR